MASHPVAANLLMLVFILGGFLSYLQTTQEVFPEFSTDTITVSIGYPGASPEEVEQSLVLAIEQALKDVDNLGEITATAREGSASVTAEVLDVDNITRISQEIQNAVNRINTFPVAAENITVSINSRRRDVISLAVYGPVDEFTLRTAAEQVRHRLEQDPDIGPVELAGTRDYEIQIEVAQEQFRRYQLSLADIASKVNQTALTFGGGSLKTTGGEILIRLSERRDVARAFEDIPIMTQENGAIVRLSTIATIKEGFAQTDDYAFYNNQAAIDIDVYRIGKQTPISVANAVKAQVDQINKELPKGLQVATFNDRSKLFAQRATLLLKNGLTGLLLVVILLALFLDIRLAFWVSMGIPISFLGAFLLFPVTDFTVNIISMFAFIIALGIVVDDAIICGENIHRYREQGLPPLQAAIAGAQEIAIPITVSILTNIAAFVPLLFIPGQMGKVFSIIPIVVIVVFIISLVESLFVLPAHLRFQKADKADKKPWRIFISEKQKRFNQKFAKFVQQIYAPFLEKTILSHRYLVLATFVAVLLVVLTYVISGRMGMTLFPRVESDFAFAEATLPVGAPYTQAEKVADQLITSAQEVIQNHGDESLATGIRSSIRENVIQVRVYLTSPEVRPISTSHFTTLWREQIGEIPGLQTLSLLANRGGPGSGAAIALQLSHYDTVMLNRAAAELAVAIAEFPNTQDIDEGLARGKRQYDLQLKPLASILGLSSSDIARQVRDAFYGNEAIKQQRNRNDVRIVVRLPEGERQSFYDLQSLPLQVSGGESVLLRDVVTVTEGRAYTSITRLDGRRTTIVSADVDPPAQANIVIATLERNTLPQLQKQYPGLQYDFAGNQAEIRDSLRSLFLGLIAVLFIIYTLLAVLFSSYGQPFMVLIAIPFGGVGAIAGHWLLGYSLSVMSLFGMMALAGVVVNDTLILVDLANRKRQEGIQVVQAVVGAAMQRMRPILLTTLTTFVGLAPMIFETSRQARFLIPMALSLGFGILFATLLTLILVPALYMVVEDIRGYIARSI
jgi:multidrug efflux pump subunit AcrB